MKVRNFDEELEKSLSSLGEHVERERAAYETPGAPEKEIVKRGLQSFSQTLPKNDVEEKEKEEAKAEDSVLPAYLREGDEGVKKEVENLVGLVFEKGLEAALKEAGKRPPFLEDAFHDALVDKLLPELRKRGMVK
ncbi:MAG: hypothetical protein HY378_01155 [Candidatus Brennerbacteria bacterium]|nr:hypothetical protein [Candidatus Brennerbacteria bacterium]